MSAILSPLHDEVPLLISEKDEAELPSPRKLTVSTQRYVEIASFFASLGLNVILVLCITLLMIRQSHSIQWKGAKPVYTPAQDAVVHELVRFESVGHAKSPYDGPPSEAVDHAWKQLYNSTSPFVRYWNADVQESLAKVGISAIPKAQAALLPNRTEVYAGDEGRYIVELDVYHQLHCLNLVRKAIWPDYYPEAAATRFTNTTDGGVFDHVDHCINTIRESLMCNADLTPVTWHWNTQDQISKFDFDAMHTCVSWDKVHSWTVENAARVKFDSHTHVVDDLVFPDDPKA